MRSKNSWPTPGGVARGAGRCGRCRQSSPATGAVIAFRLIDFRRIFTRYDRLARNFKRGPAVDMSRRAMIGLEPVDEPADAISDRGRRLEIDLAHQVLDIGIGCRDIARLHRQELALGLGADGLFKQADNLEQLDRTVVPDVVDAPGGRARSRIGLV